MANTTQYVRSQLRTEDVGKGTVLTIRVRYLPGKKPFVRVNKNPCHTNGAPDWLAASRFVLQLMEEFKLQVDRDAKKPRAG
jgi:hypothetical protein